MSLVSVSDIKYEQVDVLDHHRAQNKPNNPPSPERLLGAANTQRGIDHEPNDDGMCIEGDKDSEAEESEEDEDNPFPTRKRATRNSKSDGTVKPTTVKYYNGTAWKPALIHAKLAFRRYTMLKYFFPLTDTHLEDAELILSKTVTDMKNKVTFDSGKFVLPSIGDKSQS
jgi:hypothetical protein